MLLHQSFVERCHLRGIGLGGIEAASALVHELPVRSLNHPASAQREHVEEVHREWVVIVAESLAKDRAGSEELVPGLRYSQAGFRKGGFVEVEDACGHRDGQCVESAVDGADLARVRVELREIDSARECVEVVEATPV